jgi:hypothetical protein
MPDSTLHSRRQPGRSRRPGPAATPPSGSPGPTAGTCACAAGPTASPSRCGPGHGAPSPATAGRRTALRDLERDPPGTPRRMRPSQLAHQRLGLRRQPRRRGPRPPRRLPQPIHPSRGVPGLPRVHRLPRHPVPDRNLTDRRPVQHLQHRPVPLLDQPLPVILLLLSLNRR